MFKDRLHAGALLAARLADVLPGGGVDLERAVVFGLPRGGVPVAAVVAERLGCPLDVLMSKKVGSYENPELAIGAVSSTGVVVIDDELAGYLHTPEPFLQERIDELLKATAEKERLFRRSAGMAEQTTGVAGKCAIVVDDGIATGMTALVAVKTLKNLGAERVVLATPVCALDAVRAMAADADLFVTLIAPANFCAVGRFYIDFNQVTDEEVVEHLRSARRRQVELLQTRSASSVA